jgi:hypothetical protein
LEDGAYVISFVYSCDADPDVLAQYVLALLKNNKPTSELKESVTEQLEDFLKDRKYFVYYAMKS